MAMYSGELAPKYPEEFRFWRDFNIHHCLYSLAIGLGMDETTNTAYPLAEEDILANTIKFSSLLNSAMDITNDRHYTNNLLIFQFQLQVDRLKQDGMLRTKWNYSSCHLIPPNRIASSVDPQPPPLPQSIQ